MYVLNPYLIKKTGLNVFIDYTKQQNTVINSEKIISSEDINEYIKMEIDRIKNEELNYPDRFYNAYSLLDCDYNLQNVGQNENPNYTKPFAYITFKTFEDSDYIVKLCLLQINK
jgi:hypothetical protein